MNVSQLTRALEAGDSSERWVAAVARFFQSHDLSYGHGTDNAADEAYWLVRAQHNWLAERGAESADPRLIGSVVGLAERRVRERRPLAYLLGEAWFAGLRFSVDERVLIPRSPLAELIEHGFRPWRSLAPGDRVLDIGTGSGCVAVATAHYCPDVSVDATDISAPAMAVAASNIERHGFADRIRLIESDLFAAVEGRYRLIVSNPPYVPRARLTELPAEYGYEPVLALDGGANGLGLVDRLLAGCVDHLADDGVLIVEVGETQDAFTTSHPRLPVTWLDFERGGEGVFVLTRDQLAGYLAG